MRGPGERGGAVRLGGVHVCAAFDQAQGRRPVLLLRGIDDADVRGLGKELGASTPTANIHTTRPLRTTRLRMRVSVGSCWSAPAIMSITSQEACDPAGIIAW